MGEPWPQVGLPLFVTSEEPLWRLPVAAAIAGASYRQADHWITTGALKVTVRADGSGSQRLLTRDDVEALCRMVQLRDVGIPLAKAADPPERLAAIIDEDDIRHRLDKLDRTAPAAQLQNGREVVVRR